MIEKISRLILQRIKLSGGGLDMNFQMATLHVLPKFYFANFEYLYFNFESFIPMACKSSGYRFTIACIFFVFW